MNVEVVLFGLACLVTIAVARQTPCPQDRWDAVMTACVLACVFVVSNIAWTTGSMRAFPFMDAVIFAGFTRLFWDRLHGWRVHFLAIAAVQILLDIAFEIDGYRPYTIWAILLDATFGLQLVLVSSDGAKNVRDRLWPVRRDLLR